MRPLLVVLLLLAVPLAGCALDAPEEGTSSSERDPGAAAPAWSFTDTEGVMHARDAPPGNATVLFFMATWCSSCRSKAPLLAAVHEDYADLGVRFYSLDFDASESAEDLESWKERYRQPWPHGIDPQLHIQRAFGVTSQSSVVLLDAEGHMVKRWEYGRVNEPELRGELDRALAA